MEQQGDFQSATCTDIDVDEPKNYTVVLLNDDYTTKEFVVEILTGVFHKTPDEAVVLMETVHRQGKASVGKYPYDIAVTRVSLTTRLARKNGFPLRCELQEV